MNHEHVYTTLVRTLPDGRDVVRCACGHEKTLLLAKQKPAQEQAA
jgi:hypothetical protein